jgi:hypothetical protein
VGDLLVLGDVQKQSISGTVNLNGLEGRNVADILIRGMEMPKDRSLWILIRPDGTVYKIKDNDKLGIPKEGAAISLPEGHGRLIDADCLLRDHPELADCDFIHPKYDITLRELIEDAPTIVPAEGGGE